MYARHLQPLLRELLAEFRIVYLTGPRQAGKTTLARSISRDLSLEYVTLDDQATLASVWKAGSTRTSRRCTPPAATTLLADPVFPSVS